MEYNFFERDTSWLHFNHRVLQEAQDERVPLYERLKFLAIYSSNLDEFFRVRVASLRSFKKLRKKDRRNWLDVQPKTELKTIRTKVHQQQQAFGKTFREQVLPALASQGIRLLKAEEYNSAQIAFVENYFAEKVRPLLHLEEIQEDGEIPFLNNRQLYFIIPAVGEDNKLFVLNIPSEKLDRFHRLPGDGFPVTFLDEIIRYNLPYFFPNEKVEAYSIKLSRDAELYIDNEYDGDLVEKIRNSLSERQDGLPTRFLYDSRMPKKTLNFLKKLLGLSKHDMIPGGRYHNFHDFFGFPAPDDRPELHYPDMPPLAHPVFEGTDDYFAILDEADQMLHFPYQKYDYIPAFIQQAATDPDVTQIKITLYRVANRSNVVEALLEACRQGKEVVVFVEAKARFDEESNLFWGGELERAGAKVRYSYPGIKVHTKLLLIGKSVAGELKYYTYLGTGNFNEKTARLYADHALLTADQRLGEDTAKVFELLEGDLILPRCKHLLVAPFSLQDKLLHKINREIQLAEEGKPAALLVKLNGLEEFKMMKNLCRAAAAGVHVRLIVRGICGIRPGAEHCEGNIEAISILDRFLEHARIYQFANNGDKELYIASADWMSRNLYRRVEVAIPIYDAQIRADLQHILDLQWRDNVKARIIDADHQNLYRQKKEGEPDYRSQMDIYAFLQQKLEANIS